MRERNMFFVGINVNKDYVYIVAEDSDQAYIIAKNITPILQNPVMFPSSTHTGICHLELGSVFCRLETGVQS